MDRRSRFLKAALLVGVSAAAIIAAEPARALVIGGRNGGVSPTAIAAAAAQAAAAQAAAAAQQSQKSLTAAIGALRSMQQLQANARSAALSTSSTIPNGLAVGGLNPLVSTWQNVSGLSQSVSNGQTIVNIVQSAPAAILNWTTFNVGRNTTLNFLQQSSNWTALNRVLDPSMSPSVILGQINAPGGVYVINRNGIIFGAGSQVNVHALIASDMDVGNLGMTQAQRDQFFLNTGVASGSTALSFSSDLPVTAPLNVNGGTGAGIFNAAPTVGGGVVVQAGASITTDEVGSDSPGFIYLMGANVTNFGALNSPAGQVGLVAAQAATLTPGIYGPASMFPSAVMPAGTSFRGTGFQLMEYANQYFVDASGNLRPQTSARAGTGSVVNDGLIQTPRGITVMNGDLVSVGAAGVISADTSITRNSMVLLDAITSVSMNGTISIQPDENGETLPLLSGAASSGTASNVQAFAPAFVEMSALANVVLGGSGLVSAPSASVSLNIPANIQGSAVLSPTASSGQSTFNPSITAVQQVVLEPGSVIDVAGLQNVELPISYNFISFQPRGPEFADMPLQRSGPLFGQTLWIDIRASGTRSDGTTWLGTPLADANGYVDAYGRSIDQLMTVGGNVSLSSAAGNVVQESGSVINMAGGYVQYQGGTVPMTRLIGSDGRIYTMANADPNLTYEGILDGFTVNHAHWGIKETFSDRLIGSVLPGYTEAHSAGGLTISAVDFVEEGTLLFGSIAGSQQAALGQAPSLPTAVNSQGTVVNTQANNNQLPSQGYLAISAPTSVTIGAGGAPALPDNFGPTTPLPVSTAPAPSSNFVTQSIDTPLSASLLSSYGLSALSITSNDFVLAQGSTLRLAPGGNFSVLSGTIDIAGSVSAPGGQINLATDRNTLQNSQDKTKGIFAGRYLPSLSPTHPKIPNHADIFVEGVLDVSGRWVNDTGQLSDGVIGPGYINGGNVTITTSMSSSGGETTALDTTGNIVLAVGSLIDTSSGGYISPLGKTDLSAPGVMAGKAGNITLRVYQGGPWVSPGGTGSPDQPVQGLAGNTVANIQLDGTLRAYGFQSDGTLTIGASGAISLGGAPLAAGVNGLYLSSSFLNAGDFGAYVIESAPDGWTIQGTGSGTNITLASGVSLGAAANPLHQNNLMSGFYGNVGTGANISAIAPIGTLPLSQRQPVNLTLRANSLLLDQGSSIVTDPGATITLSGTPVVSQSTAALRENPSLGILLRGSVVDHGGSVSINSLATWLGPQASIDLSGTFVPNAQFGEVNGPAVSGTLLPGGTFTVTNMTSRGPDTAGSSILVAQSGSVVDVSGAAATIDVLNHGSVFRIGAAASPVSVPSWSDAGTVSLFATYTLWGGTFLASPGDPRGNGGTFMLGGGPITLTQDSSLALSLIGAVHSPTNPGTLTSLISLVAPVLGASGNDLVAADRLHPFDNVFLYSSLGQPDNLFTDLPGNNYGNQPIGFNGDFGLTILGSVNLSVANRLEIATTSITESMARSTVSLAAPYVALTGAGLESQGIGGTFSGVSATSTGGTSSLTVTGQTIDVESATLSGFSTASLISSGDIMLSTPKVADGVIIGNSSVPLDQSRYSGSLTTTGNLLLQAQRIYPVSAVDFTINTTGTVTFQAPANSDTSIPLSAGGTLTVLAPVIQQNGNLFAPLGTITLGSSATQQVTLGAGSLTSVTLADAIVPYGATQDGTDWYYNTTLNAFTQPPAKGLILDAANVNVSAGSTIDVRGGGDIQAMEFIPGKGGSRDVLSATPSGQTVYALVPSQDDPIAAFDINFTAAHSATVAGDAYPLAGLQIQIAGGGGIPAGTYTLYPGHYATLPGALRVVDQGSNLGRNIPSGTTLPDGTVLVTGNYTQSTRPGSLTSGSELFAIRTGTVWGQYSQYSISSGNTYFTNLAQQNGTNPPPLPMDGGRLAVIAQQSIVLAGSALTAPVPGGTGGQLDISASKIDIVNSVQLATLATTEPGFVGVDVTQLDNFGFESVLIGGLRSVQSDGSTLVTPTATNVLVDTRGDAFTAPELILVAQTSTNTPGAGAITVASGSIIDTTGVVNTVFARSYALANAANAGALFVATNDPLLAVSGPTGAAATNPALGVVSVQAGAQIATGNLSVQASASTNAIQIDPRANLDVRHATLSAKTIGIGSASGSAGFLLSSANVAQFAGVQALTLRSLNGPLTFFGPVTFAPGGAMQQLTLDANTIAGTGGNVTIDIPGGTVTLVNSGLIAPPPAPGVNGSFTIDAGNIALAGGQQAIAGFAQVNWNASAAIRLGGAGALSLGATSGTTQDIVNLAVTTPDIVVAGATSSGSGSFALTTNGGATVQGGSGGAPGLSNEIGGNFALTAGSLVLDTTVQAQAGTVTLHTTGSSGLALGANAYIAAGGFKKTLIDVDTFVAGGTVTLQADSGNVVTNPGSVIDVAQPVNGSGYGGSITVTAAAGVATLGGTIRAFGGPGVGGSFTLNTQGAVDLNSVADILGASGANGSISITSGTGNLVLAQGHTLQANSVTLTANDMTNSTGSGVVSIAGTIDARGYGGTTPDGTGEAGGQVNLFGANAVVLGSGGVIDASTTHSDQRGGDVMIGVAWNATMNSAAIGIDLQPGSTIDVSGGTRGGLSGGTVTLRAPLNGQSDMMIQEISSNIKGTQTVTAEGYVAFSTDGSNGVNTRYGIGAANLTTSSGGTTGWNGVINPVAGNPPTVKFTLTSGGSGYTGVPTVTFTNSSGQTIGTGTATMGMALGNVPISGGFNVGVSGTFNIVFPSPTGGTNAQGTITLTGGFITNITITSSGSGFTSPPTSFNVPQLGVTAFNPAASAGYSWSPTLAVVSVTVPNIATAGTVGVTFSGGGTNAVEASATLTVQSAGSNPGAFFTDVVKNFVQGQWTIANNAPANYDFTRAQARLASHALLGGATVQIQPGVELVNPDPNINGGDITVASNWNLAAGTAFNLGLGAGNTTIYSPTSSYVQLMYRYMGIEPGALTLRAVGNINVNASISDGFFQFANYLDSTYQNNVLSYLTKDSGGTYLGIDGTTNELEILNFPYVTGTSLATMPVAPYNTSTTATANVANPDSLSLADSDLFPQGLRMCTTACGTANAVVVSVANPGSWTYRLTAGADVASADPFAVQSPSALAAGKGSVIVNGHTATTEKALSISFGFASLTNVAIDLPTMIRTGTGDITVSAAEDVALTDTTAPGVIYAAGVNTAPPVPDPGYKMTGGGTALAVTNANGYLEPQILNYNVNYDSSGSYVRIFGPPTAAAFPTAAGDVTISAQRDIDGVANPTQSGHPAYQYFAPWLLADGEPTIPNSISASIGNLLGEGVFAPIGVNTGLQSSWWIQFASFDQGFLSAGGNITVTAGRNLNDVSVSAPSTGRTTGGLSTTSTPVVYVYGSGNMVVRAGANIFGGSFYEGSGQASIVARGSVGADDTISVYSGGQLTPVANLPVLAVDSGQIYLVGSGSVSVGGVVNPAELHPQMSSFVNPLVESSGFQTFTPLYMDTYGPDSAVSIVAIGGNLNIADSPASYIYSPATLPHMTAANYPASFSAIALSGNVTTTPVSNQIQGQGIILSGSPDGTFQLLAEGSVDLTGGYNAAAPVSGTTVPAYSSGPSLLEAAFDPFQPNDGFDGAFSQAVLAHQDDASIARIYAVTGDITGAGTAILNLTVPAAGKPSVINPSDPVEKYLRVEMNQPTRVFAGQDIVDLNMVVQNIEPSDVSSVQAGRDITYTGHNNAGGLQVAGPGFFVVQAGRNLGPFLPLSGDATSTVYAAEGIISIANGGLVPVGNILPGVPANTLFDAAGGGTGSPVIGIYDPALFGAFNSLTKRRNPFLPSSGADIVTMFGVAKGIDYAAVVSAYIDPATAQSQNFASDLTAFLKGLCKGEDCATTPTIGSQAAWLAFQASQNDPQAAWQLFQTLPANVQQIFVDQVFFDELKVVGNTANQGSPQYQLGYQMINTMFPASFGYTANELGGGTNGANQLVQTGNLDLLHATIETQLGGNISIFGPGGSILVGSLATEPNTNLKLSDLGILTLGGGTIDTFTDQNVVVNASRVLTTQGGDVLMWSSNGNLDAGRGAKTTLSLPPLNVQFDGNDYQTVDLGGLVTGAGIGVLKTSNVAQTSDLFLLAPRGTVDAGDAGLRASGNITIAAVQVLNASNIQAGGSVTGVPTVTAPNIGALSQANNAAGSAAKPDMMPTGKVSEQPSIIIVEVVGYGGSSGDEQRQPQQKRQEDDSHKDQRSQDLNSSVRVVGAGGLTDQEQKILTDEEKRNLVQ